MICLILLWKLKWNVYYCFVLWLLLPFIVLNLLNDF